MIICDSESAAYNNEVKVDEIDKFIKSSSSQCESMADA